ncbi:MAG TPA: hypothetical protein VHT28_11835 [Silvibacterium sp.]|nr:hypothetical protein [Silvibacterium sp.]
MKQEQNAERRKEFSRELHLAGMSSHPASEPQRDDGTRQLLHSGGWTIAAGLLAAILMATVFGGITRQGPHTNSGWLALIVALMCLPFGSLLFVLGAAKWFRNRRLRRGH